MSKACTFNCNECKKALPQIYLKCLLNHKDCQRRLAVLADERDRYVVDMATGNLTQYYHFTQMNDSASCFSGQWRLQGIMCHKDGRYRGKFVSLEKLTDMQFDLIILRARYKRIFIVDYDHGSTRHWSSRLRDAYLMKGD